MSKLHVNQIEGQITRLLADSIDMSDLRSHTDPEVVKKAFLTRGLAVLAAACLTDIAPTDLAKYVTDGKQDGGIDLICYDDKNKKLFFVQSKWHSSGHGSIELGDTLKFLNGVKTIIDFDLTNFNEKIRSLSTEIREALFQSNTSIILVIAHQA